MYRMGGAAGGIAQIPHGGKRVGWQGLVPATRMYTDSLTVYGD